MPNDERKWEVYEYLKANAEEIILKDVLNQFNHLSLNSVLEGTKEWLLCKR